MPSITSPATTVLRGAGDYLADLVTPTLRLGVTGLARAGKTVFITALVRNLVEGGRLPFFGPEAEGRVVRAFLAPQPDDAVPRFAYEEHLDALARDPPEWPESTRRISQLRITIEYMSASRWKRALGISRLHIDIVDYPGEWLLDLGLIDLDYRAWSKAAVERAQDKRHQVIAGPWLSHVKSLQATGPQDEQAALAGSRLYAAYLRDARQAGLETQGPGRFMMPGDLDGSPLLTFMPLLLQDGISIPRGSLAAMLERRYESYKSHVAVPFFRDHFSRIDRQIVLVDALAALNGGDTALGDVRRTLGAVLAPFKVGSTSWLMSLLTRRIDRVLFAAAKADHVHHSSHARLEAVLAHIADEVTDRAMLAGAEIKLMALSALRATREAEVKRSGEFLPCIVGVPLPGEQIANQSFAGSKPVVVFPGDLPSNVPQRTAGTVAISAEDRDVRFIRFRPPRIPRETLGGTPAPWPHIRLDRALDFLVADHLA